MIAIVVLAVMFALSFMPPIVKGIVFFLGISFAYSLTKKYANKNNGQQNNDDGQNDNLK